MNGRRLFKRQSLGRRVPLRSNLAHQRIAARIEVALHPPDFRGIVRIRTTAKAGCQTHFHVGIDAARKRRVGMQVVHAAPHFEEIQRVVHELLRSSPREERAVVDRATIQLAEPRGHRSPGKLVFQVQLDQRSEAEPHALDVGLGKNFAQRLIKNKPALEIRTRPREFNAAHQPAQA